MKLDDLEKIEFLDNSRLNFNHDLSRLNWFNIGGKSKVYLFANSLKDLTLFLKLYSKRGKIFILGAGSNILFGDDTYEGVVIKLGKNFNNISRLSKNLIISGSSCLDKKVSEFAMENEIEGFEFLSCIPGTVGGGIRMNAGCYGKEFKDIIVSVQAVDFNGKVLTIPASEINFQYRSTNLPKELIYLSGTFKGNTSGSTFKNPIDQSDKKVWELIRESVDIKKVNEMFGDAKLSEKHCNFLINQAKASSQDMKNLINFVKENVYKKTGVNIELEIVLTS